MNNTKFESSKKNQIYEGLIYQNVPFNLILLLNMRF